MKYIREISDIHLDHDAASYHPRMPIYPGDARPTCAMDVLWYPEPMEGDDETTLILAGDLWVNRRFLRNKHPADGLSWMQVLAQQFKYVIFVLGNHDYWDANITYETTRIKLELKKQGLDHKVFLLENDEIVLDQVKFVGGTLWTSYNESDPLLMFMAPQKMNDYKYIRSGPDFKKVHPRELLKKHLETRNFIFTNAIKDDPSQTLVVVTHMAPSLESLSVRRRLYSNEFNFYYYTELSRQILNNGEIDYWFHGHTHDPADYMIGNTRMICNPRGYSGHEFTGYDPLWRVSV